MRNVGRRILNGYQAHPFRALFVGAFAFFGLAIFDIFIPLLPNWRAIEERLVSLLGAGLGIPVVMGVGQFVIAFAFAGWLYGKTEPAREGQ